ncbi:MAG: glycosyltransferase family 2 protein [Candidatus Rokuibacteriota bacterium]
MSWRQLGLVVALTYNHLVLAYFLGISAYYLVLMLLGFRETLRAAREMHWQDARRLMQSRFTPPISVLATAYNEEASIVESVRSLLMLHYPQFEVIVVNDGSTDRTLEVLMEQFSLRPVSRAFEYAVPCKPIRRVFESLEYPNLVVVDKENGGCKADAANGGLNLALYPLVCVLDADSVLDEDALLRAVRPFVEDPELTVATGGTVRIVNGCEIRAGRVVRVRVSPRWLPRFQTVEYLRGFLFGRMGWSQINGLIIISGAFGLFDKRAVLRAGGYAATSLGEDFELVVRLHRSLRERREPYRVRFVPDPICWTEVPETLRTLARQRNRWHRGLLDTLVRHRGMIGRPRYGVVGLLALPCAVVFELLGPVIELSGYVVVPLCYALGILNTPFMMAFVALAFLLSMLLSVVAVLLDDVAFRRHPRTRDLVVLVLAAILENVGYRQITVWWRTRAFWDYWCGNQAWGQMERRGLGRT